MPGAPIMLRRILWITGIIVIRNLRDYGSMALQVLLPVAVVAILGNTLGNVQHYTVVMIVLMVLFAIIYSGDSLVELRSSPVAVRFDLARVHPVEQHLAVWIASALTTTVQGVLIVAATGMLFQIPWMMHLPGVIAVIVVLSVCAAGGGILAVQVFPRWEQARSLLQALVFFWTFIAGGFIPFPATRRVVHLLRTASPAHYGQRALLALLTGSPAEHLTQFFLVMGVAGAGILVLSTAAYGARCSPSGRPS